MSAAEWREQAACAGEWRKMSSEADDPFFNIQNPYLTAQALALCASCPVRVQCQTEYNDIDANSTYAVTGVWAGEVHGSTRRKPRPTRTDLSGAALNRYQDPESIAKFAERRARWEAGMSDREIAELEGSADSTITTWRSRYGLAFNRDTRPVGAKPARGIELRMGLYEAGLTDGEIARQTHVSRDSIWAWRQRNNLPRQDQRP